MGIQDNSWTPSGFIELLMIIVVSKIVKSALVIIDIML